MVNVDAFRNSPERMTTTTSHNGSADNANNVRLSTRITFKTSPNLVTTSFGRSSRDRFDLTRGRRRLVAFQLSHYGRLIEFNLNSH